MPDLRSLPSVDLLLQSAEALAFCERYGRPLTLQALRETLEDVRRRAASSPSIPGRDALLQAVGQRLQQWTRPSLLPVINATGVILHTNLGRAPLSQAALQAIQETSLGYANLEFDLETGKRGSRSVHAEALIKSLTGAEAALVVNNNAAAVLLALSALARRQAVIIARSQLVEIGGGFRVPDVMKQSGARLVEVGATNRVHRADFENALAENPQALVMRAHRSNFKISGFTSEPSLAEIVEIAHQAGRPVFDDLGSGTFLDTAQYGLTHEPTIQESLAAGADLVSFSGDKLLGGPQAGILAGKADLIQKLKKHPLARAVRADKLCLAALSATLLHYLKDEALATVPIWRMISSSPESLQRRAQSWQQSLGCGDVIPALSTIGGGSLPEEMLPTHVLALSLPSPARKMASLRQANPPVVARLEENKLLFDARTVLPEQEPDLLRAIQSIL